MTDARRDERLHNALWIALAAVALLRLLSLGLYPVMETTEARYAEIGRLMVELNDWVTPWFDYGVPFWGKPPASFWATALGLKVFGINEFAARVPHWLGGVVIGVLAWTMARRRSPQEAVYAPVLLAGSLLFLVASGAVMTDVTLVVGTTLAMAGFWQGLHGTAADRRRGPWLLFTGLAIGLLAKGPVAVVLAGLPMAAWTLLHRQLGRAWRELPWLAGAAGVALLAVPWYLLAEQRTPGFLQYFIVGEHLHRFVSSGWHGDLYGKAHAFPRGTIWVFALLACLPWALLLPVAAWWSRRDTAPAALSPEDRAWRNYLLCWALTPCVFFTMAGNILATYVLPALPAIALLAAGWLARRFDARRAATLLLAGMAINAAIMVGGLAWLQFNDIGDFRTAKALVRDYQAQRRAGEELVYLGKAPHSAAFYLQAATPELDDTAALSARLQQGPVFVAIHTDQVRRLPADLAQQLRPAGDHGEWTLLVSRPVPAR